MHRLILTSDASPLRCPPAFFTRHSPTSPVKSSSLLSSSPSSSSPSPHTRRSSQSSSSSSSSSSSHPSQPRGAYILGHWIPFDIWPRIAKNFTSTYDQKAFQSICQASYNAIQCLQAPRLRSITSTFHMRPFTIPPDIVDNVVMVHVVPPHANSLILFLDESESGNGVEMAWLKDGVFRRIPLGLDTVPASTVSNIIFSPDGKRIAFLVTLAHGALIAEHIDPLHRLRGWDRFRRSMGNVYDIVYDPCEDCTVQVVDLVPDDLGMPAKLDVHTFSHVFVPEYGFDMTWKQDADGEHELVFAAMLHSAAGAATYLVRWRNFNEPDQPHPNFVFMACIDGASTELLKDKQKAMSIHEATKCTSRIEIANDAKSIFFDTVSKFGILRFDQVIDAATSRVTRADLPNNPAMVCEGQAPTSASPAHSPARSPKTCKSPTSREKMSVRQALGQLNVGNPDETRQRTIAKYAEESTRMSRMSPDGKSLCSIVCLGSPTIPLNNVQHTKHIEVRSSTTGRLIYRRLIRRPWDGEDINTRFFKMPFEKSADVALQTMAFSQNSALIVLWDTHFSRHQVVFSRRLPIVLDAGTGRVIQTFNSLSKRVVYEAAQMAPDALTMYGTRMYKGKIVMDAIDVLCGAVLKTVAVTGSVYPPLQFSAHSNYLLRDNVLHTVSRGWVDVLWQTTRGSLGCGWTSRLRPDEHEVYGDVQED